MFLKVSLATSRSPSKDKIMSGHHDPAPGAGSFVTRASRLGRLENWEEFTRMKLSQGGELRKYYPLTAEAQAEYEAWKSEQKR